MNAADIGLLYEYNKWANNLILNAADALDPTVVTKDTGASHQSILGTLIHLFWAETIWLKRWKRETMALPGDGDKPTDLGDLRARWESLESDRSGFLSQLDDDLLRAELQFNDVRGNQHSSPLGLLIFHCANHSTLHRGQIMTMIRMLGSTPPATDFPYFLRDKNAA